MRLHDLLDHHADQHPDRTLAELGGRSLTYGEAVDRSRDLARALLASGVGAGDRFAYLAQNCLEYAYLYFAASRVGAVPVPLNYRLAPRELAYVVGDAGATLLVAQQAFVEGLEAERESGGADGALAGLRHRIQLGGEPAPGWTAYDAWLEAGADVIGEGAGGSAGGRGDGELGPVAIGPDADLYQMYTSGTTGHPKGVVLTHRAVLSQVLQFNAAMDFRHGDRVLTVAPMYHAAAAVTSMTAVAQGGTLVLHEAFDPVATVRALSGDRIHRTTLVPAMIQACLQAVPDVAERSYDDLRLILYGASPIAEATLRQAMEVFGCEFLQAFGMTETTGGLTLLGPHDHRQALAGRPGLLLSAGKPLPGTRIRIVDDEGEPVPPGTIGEIVGTGPQLMRGYWNLPEATAGALRDGWMHTGDGGRLDEDGYLYIEDRIKDMIVSGGENVYPREVENVLFEHEAIADCAVIGVPSERWGEEVKAVVALTPGASLTGAELIEFCRGKLGGYKIPRSVDVVEAIPRNASGKVLKRDLRDPYWEGRDRRVS